MPTWRRLHWPAAAAPVVVVVLLAALAAAVARGAEAGALVACTTPDAPLDAAPSSSSPSSCPRTVFGPTAGSVFRYVPADGNRTGCVDATAFATVIDLSCASQFVAPSGYYHLLIDCILLNFDLYELARSAVRAASSTSTPPSSSAPAAVLVVVPFFFKPHADLFVFDGALARSELIDLADPRHVRECVHVAPGTHVLTSSRSCSVVLPPRCQPDGTVCGPPNGFRADLYPSRDFLALRQRHARLLRARAYAVLGLPGIDVTSVATTAATTATTTPSGPLTILFIERNRRSNSRVLDNLDEVRTLVQHSFPGARHTTYYGNEPLAATIKLFAQSDIVVAFHGAGLANTIFCRDGAMVLEFTFFADKAHEGLWRSNRGSVGSFHNGLHWVVYGLPLSVETLLEWPRLVNHTAMALWWTLENVKFVRVPSGHLVNVLDQVHAFMAAVHASVRAMVCPPGTAAGTEAPAGECAECPAGTGSTADGTACVPCRRGSFSSSPAAATCTLCPAGTAAAAAGQRACAPCAQPELCFYGAAGPSSLVRAADPLPDDAAVDPAWSGGPGSNVIGATLLLGAAGTCVLLVGRRRLVPALAPLAAWLVPASPRSPINLARVLAAWWLLVIVGAVVLLEGQRVVIGGNEAVSHVRLGGTFADGTPTTEVPVRLGLAVTLDGGPADCSGSYIATATVVGWDDVDLTVPVTCRLVTPTSVTWSAVVPASGRLQALPWSTAGSAVLTVAVAGAAHDTVYAPVVAYVLTATVPGDDGEAEGGTAVVQHQVLTAGNGSAVLTGTTDVMVLATPSGPRHRYAFDHQRTVVGQAAAPGPLLAVRVAVQLAPYTIEVRPAEALVTPLALATRVLALFGLIELARQLAAAVITACDVCKT